MNDQEADRLIHTEEPASVERGLEYLRARAEADPDDAERWFIYGGGLDFSDRAEEAIVAYGRVFDIGIEALAREDQPRIYVQAGSTLRNLGRLPEARRLLEEGRRRFPEFRAISAFPRPGRGQRGRGSKAIDLLLSTLVADDSDDSINHYRRALTWYASEIVRGSALTPVRSAWCGSLRDRWGDPPHE
jgi:tetratricopeptide (TPR) repeat protein